MQIPIVLGRGIEPRDLTSPGLVVVTDHLISGVGSSAVIPYSSPLTITAIE